MVYKPKWSSLLHISYQSRAVFLLILWWGCPYESDAYDSPVFRPLDYIWMNIKDWWNGNWKGKPEIFKKNVLHFYFFHHRSHEERILASFLRSEAVHLCTFFRHGKLFHPPSHITSSLTVACIPSSLFSNILCLRFNLSDQVSHPYKISCTIVVAYCDLHVFGKETGIQKVPN